MLLLIDSLVGLLAPHICKECGRVGSTYCSCCVFNTTKRNYPICLFCGQSCKSNNLCPACRHRHPEFSQLYCIGERRGSLRHLVGDYKYNSEMASCHPLAQLLANRLSFATLSDAVIVPIPTISAHIRQRGFDHMLLLAQQLGKLVDCRVDSRLLYRTNNVSQHQLSLADRRKLIKSSLAVRRPQSTAAPSTVLLLDDIWTTGSTMMAAADLLRSIGIERIIGCVVVQQPKSPGRGDLT